MNKREQKKDKDVRLKLKRKYPDVYFVRGMALLKISSKFIQNVKMVERLRKAS
jgi:hypothetical protein